MRNIAFLFLTISVMLLLECLIETDLALDSHDYLGLHCSLLLQ